MAALLCGILAGGGAVGLSLGEAERGGIAPMPIGGGIWKAEFWSEVFYPPSRPLLLSMGGLCRSRESVVGGGGLSPGRRGGRSRMRCLPSIDGRLRIVGLGFVRGFQAPQSISKRNKGLRNSLKNSPELNMMPGRRKAATKLDSRY